MCTTNKRRRVCVRGVLCVWGVLRRVRQLAPAIATAIRDSGLNLNPSVEDNVVKVPLPKWVVAWGLVGRVSCEGRVAVV
jgi:hypothetical protein